MYQFKELYTLDFTKAEYYWQMHEIIRESLDFPDYYGCNWSAFRDCLTDMIGAPIHIEIIGLENVEQRFDDSASKMLNILKDFKHYHNDRYVNDIQIEIVTGDLRTSIS